MLGEMVIEAHAILDSYENRMLNSQKFWITYFPFDRLVAETNGHARNPNTLVIFRKKDGVWWVIH